MNDTDQKLTTDADRAETAAEKLERLGINIDSEDFNPSYTSNNY